MIPIERESPCSSLRTGNTEKVCVVSFSGNMNKHHWCSLYVENVCSSVHWEYIQCELCHVAYKFILYSYENKWGKKKKKIN